MAYWLLKTEPSIYSFADLQRDGCAMWDGVRNAQALIHIRSMRHGDGVLIYHSGEERTVVGTGTVDGEPYADPDESDPKLVVVDVCADRAAAKPVTLARIKADPLFADMALVRQPRLSVLPVAEEQWRRILEMAGIDGGG